MNQKREKIISTSFFILVCLVLYLVLFFPPRMGAANNGDFYRLAERCSVYGFESFTDDPYPFFSKIYEKWNWEELDWSLLTPAKQSCGNIWPIMLVRLIINVVSSTDRVPFSTYYLSLVYAGLFLGATILLIKFALKIIPRGAIILIFTAIIMFMGSMHLAWFNSFYGEAMLYVGLLLSLGLFSHLICFSHTPPVTIFLLFLTCFSNYLFLTGKSQNVLAWPFWVIMLVIVTIFVYKKSKNGLTRTAKRIFGTVCTIIVGIYIIYSGISCYKLYQWNSELNEKDTLYQAIMLGALEIAQSEEEEQIILAEMDLSPELALDKGKHAYLPSEEYNIAPRSEKAEELLYNKINTFGLLKFYITHPKYLYRALEITSSQAVYPATSLLMPKQDTPIDVESNHGRFTLWENFRPLLVPHHFWQYVIIYLILFITCIRYLIYHKTELQHKILICLYMLIMMTGIIQFPLPFIGNGLADTNKQLYLFMLCWDITALVAIAWVVNQLYKKYID